MQTFLSLLIIGTLLGVSVARNDLYRSSLALWQDTVAGSPRKGRTHYVLGNVWMDAGNLDQARQEWERTFELNPAFTPALTQLGNYWFVKGYLDRAEQFYREALAREPENSEVAYNYAVLLDSRKMPQDAVRYYRLFLQHASTGYAQQAVHARERIQVLTRTR